MMAGLQLRLLSCFAFLCFLSIQSSWADIPVHCLWEETAGKWKLHEGERGGTNEIQCKGAFEVKSTIEVELKYPNVAEDSNGNLGTWTLIYDQGFELIINDRVYFAFFDYEVVGKQVISHCGLTSAGWAHDVSSQDWACYYGEKVTAVPDRVTYLKSLDIYKDKVFQEDADLVERINKAGTTWKAKLYKQDIGKPFSEFVKKLGGVLTQFNYPPPAPKNQKINGKEPVLPESIDWRNIRGINYVSPVQDQLSCGSCFAFASTGMLESRIRILTNNQKNPILSAQDIVSCSQYDQGCMGGFAYLVAGKYGKDFGLVDEDYSPYLGIDTDCNTSKDAPRRYTANYSYIGGYYGGTNEENMMQALVSRGPIAVGFMVHTDFYQYSGGVYQYTGLHSKFNPFVLVNHAVLVVGYGVDAETGLKYWIVKNSWGDWWGMDGYFMIRRGTNECGIESIAFEANPIP